MSNDENSERHITWTQTFQELDGDLRQIAYIVRSHGNNNNHPRQLYLYVLALEDRRFARHPGYDIKSICRSFCKTFTGTFGGGASTIEQQLVRTVTGQRSRTISRKLREIAIARRLSAQFPKTKILCAYLNVAYLGYRLIGVEQASKRLYEKNLCDLHTIELANIASLLLYPKPRVPTPEWQAKLSRRAKYALKNLQFVREFDTLFPPQILIPLD